MRHWWIATIVANERERRRAIERHVYAYEVVDRDYAEVREVLEQTPARLIDVNAGAGDLEVLSELEAHVLGATVAKPVKAEFGEFRDAGRSTCYRDLVWSSPDAPHVYPRMDGELEATALGLRHTQISFIGHYDPPLGVIGDVGDAAGLNRVANDAVRHFIAQVAERLSRIDVQPQV
jgi:hypothetical protein